MVVPPCEVVVEEVEEVEEEVEEVEEEVEEVEEEEIVCWLLLLPQDHHHHHHPVACYLLELSLSRREVCFPTISHTCLI